MVKRTISSAKNERVSELELICGGKEAEIEEAIDKLNAIREKNIVQNGLIGDFLPTLERISMNVLKRAKEEGSSLVDEEVEIDVKLIERTAILALSKIMCVSGQLGKKNIGLVFELLHSPID
jgi:hypothetical protein